MLVICVLSMAMARPAHGIGGIDLSINACPGNPGAVGTATPSIDCASGAGIILLGTWAPAEDVTGLVGMDGVIDVNVPDGLDGNGFWDFDPAGCNVDAMIVNHVRPSTGCATPVAYTDTWPVGSGSGVAAYRTSGNTLRIAFTCYRANAIDVMA